MGKEQEVEFFVTNDRFLREGGLLDDQDKAILEEARVSGKVELVMMSCAEAFEKMRQEEPRKFEKFSRKMAEAQGARALSFKELVQLARESGPRVEEHRQYLRRSMGLAQARTIRMWRVDQHCTWRRVARQAYHMVESGGWPAWKLWGPPSNQVAGMVLTEVAAKFFQEDFMAPPWN